MWNAKDKMVVDRRQQLLLATAEPLLSCIGLALWAMAVTTRVERDGLVTAMIALITMPAQSGGAAADNGIENLDLWPSQGSPIPLPEPRTCRANDVGHLEGWPSHDCGASVDDIDVCPSTGS